MVIIQVILQFYNFMILIIFIIIFVKIRYQTRSDQTIICVGNTKNILIVYQLYRLSDIYLCTIIMVYLIIQLQMYDRLYHHFTGIIDWCLEKIFENIIIIKELIIHIYCCWIYNKQCIATKKSLIICKQIITNERCHICIFINEWHCRCTQSLWVISQ